MLPSDSSFDVAQFLSAPSLGAASIELKSNAIVFAQGDRPDAIFYLKRGSVKFSTVSPTGREAVVAIFRVGEFFGEDALMGTVGRPGTATTMTACGLMRIAKERMIRLLHEQHDMSDLFITYLLVRNARLQEDLVDKLLNSIEKRLARVLLMLARYGTAEGPQRILPKVSQAGLAEMIGSTRARVNFFMNKFRRLGYIDYNGALMVNDSLLKVVLQETAHKRPQRPGPVIKDDVESRRRAGS
jgi:CRP-like cAMP-binding protein